MISIHALLAESDVFVLRKITITVDISIHALLAESDANDAINGCNSDFISIHALLAESDGGGLLNCFVKILFLSTLSLRRATAEVGGSN